MSADPYSARIASDRSPLQRYRRAIVCGELRVGEMVKVDIRIAERTLSTVAIVRHSSNVRSGFEFVGLTAEERQEVAHCMGQS